VIRKSSLPLIGFIVGLCVIGALVTISVGDYGSCSEESSFVYLRVISDSPANVPVQGAKVEGNVQWSCAADTPSGYVTQYSVVKSQVTPYNGTISLGTIVGNYSVSVQYLGQKYFLNFNTFANETNLVVLSVPEGQVRYLECTAPSISECL